MAKKIVSMPAPRVEEEFRIDFCGIADLKGVTESELMRIACSRLLDEEMAKYQALHQIFAGRDRRSNQSRAPQCVADTDNEVVE